MSKRFNTKALLGILTIALVITSLVITVIPVMAAPVTQTITLASGNTTQTAGYSTSNTSSNPLNPTLYSGIGSWFSAPVISVIPGPWVTIPGAQWVSTISTNYGDDNNYPGDGWRLFKDEFTIPSGASNLTVTIQVAADNAFEFYLNNTLIDSTQNWTPVCTVYGVSPVPHGSPLPYTNTVTYTITPQIGANTIMFVVRNWALSSGNNPTGLLYYASITYDTSSGQPASIGGTIYKVDKLGLVLPWLGVGLGALVVLFWAIHRFFFRNKQRIPSR